MRDDAGREWLAAFVGQTDWPVEIERLVGLVGEQIVAQPEGVPMDAELRRALDASNRAQWYAFLAAVGGRSFEVRVPEEVLDLARTIARRNLDIEAMVKGRTVGQRVLWRYITRTVQERTPDAELRSRMLILLWERVVESLDAAFEAGLAVYTAEREQLQRGMIGRRTAAVHALLRGDQMDVEDTSAALGHSLRQHQTALALWLADNAAEPDAIRALERHAGDIATALGGLRPLTVASGARGLWAWVATARPTTAVPPILESRPGIHVAMGTSLPGIAGFVGSHREALAAQRVADAGVGMPALVRYVDVELVCLTTGDGSIDAMRALIARELGPLAECGDPAARLRETLRVFLAHGASFPDAAAELGLHANTVRYRVRQAEELLGHSIEARRMHVELALQTAHIYGDTALPGA